MRIEAPRPHTRPRHTPPETPQKREKKATKIRVEKSPLFLFLFLCRLIETVRFLQTLVLYLFLSLLLFFYALAGFTEL